MGNYYFVNILHALGYLSDSIFVGLKIFVPVIFVIKIFQINFRKLYFDTLIIVLNIFLLTGGLLFLVVMASNMLMIWNTGDSFETNFIISIATGPNWFQVIIPLVCFGFLPQVMWVRALRSSIFSTFTIVMLWFISYFLIAYLSHRAVHIDFPVAEYTKKSILLAVLVAVFYFILSRKIKPGS